MMKDHETLSQARLDLCNALQWLLSPEIMNEVHFHKAKSRALDAVKALDELLRQNHNPYETLKR